MSKFRVIVIGGGAAGFFSAIQIAENEPNAEVVILEGSNKLLSKVRVSGGGRCNVTHSCFDNAELATFYPRGSKELRQVFARFSVQDMQDWLFGKGIKLRTEEDGRMFPSTNDSSTIVNCFLEAAQKNNIEILREFKVCAIEKNKRFIISGDQGQRTEADRIVVSIGGNASASFYDLLLKLGHTLVPPVPSLFTFNIPDKKLHSLLGISVPDAMVSIPAFKLKEEGPLLITHWGFSGPAILKLSASGARKLHEQKYRFSLFVNWLGNSGEEKWDELQSRFRNSGGAMVKNSLLEFPQRLREFLLLRSNIDLEKRCADLSKSNLQKFKQVLLADEYLVEGKTTFKEEFVTCGGVPLSEIDMRTMESKKMPGIYFAGEVLDIDGYTGGFNFQAAWSTSFIAAKSIIGSKTVHLS